jgi:hypothetical protein
MQSTFDTTRSCQNSYCKLRNNSHTEKHMPQVFFTINSHFRHYKPLMATTIKFSASIITMKIYFYVQRHQQESEASREILLKLLFYQSKGTIPWLQPG